MLKEQIANYEKRYKTDVVGVALIGSVGRWAGSRRGGKVYDIKDVEEILSMDVDEIEVGLEDGILTIGGHHHDGSHYMQIHFITESKLKKVGLYKEYEQMGIDEINYFEYINKLSKVLKPLKLNAKNEYYKAS